MMRKKMIAVAGVCAFVLTFGLMAVAAAQQPASVAGKWELSMEGFGGRTFTETLTLKQDGKKLTGTLESRRGSRPVEGTVDGDKVTFSTSFQGRNGNTMTQKYTGTVSGDSMKGTVGFGQRDINWTAKRQK